MNLITKRTFLQLLIFLSCFTASGQFIDLGKISFQGVSIFAEKEQVIQTFGKGEVKYPYYDCGGFSDDQPGGPFYQLIYKGFRYIGGDSSNFYLEKVDFGADQELVVKYGEETFSHKTTKEDLIRIFGEKVAKHFEEDPSRTSILMMSRISDDGMAFRFKEGRLIELEYHTSC